MDVLPKHRKKNSRFCPRESLFFHRWTAPLHLWEREPDPTREPGKPPAHHWESLSRQTPWANDPVGDWTVPPRCAVTLSRLVLEFSRPEALHTALRDDK